MKNKAKVYASIVINNTLIEAFCSTHFIIPGAIYNCVKLRSTSKTAVKTQNNKTLLQFL